MLEDSLEDRLDKSGGLLSDSEKTEGDAKEGELDENKVPFFSFFLFLFFIYNLFMICIILQKKSTEGGKQGGPLKKLKKDKVVGGAGKAARGEGDKSTAAPRVKPELTLPTMYVKQFFFIYKITYKLQQHFIHLYFLFYVFFL